MGFRGALASKLGRFRESISPIYDKICGPVIVSSPISSSCRAITTGSQLVEQSSCEVMAATPTPRSSSRHRSGEECADPRVMRVMSAIGTKRNCLGAHGTSGTEGRPAVPPARRRPGALTASDFRPSFRQCPGRRQVVARTRCDPGRLNSSREQLS